MTKINKRWKLFRKMPKALKPQVDVIGSTITRLAKQLAPKFEGWLSEGIEYQIEEKRNRISLMLTNNIWWSHFQEFGFEPHFAPITPYAKRWLEAHKTGEEGVKPGLKGHFWVAKYTPHITPAIEQVRPNIPILLKRGADAFLIEIFGGIGK